MKSIKKIVSIMVMAAMLSALPGVGMFGGMVAWAFEVTAVDSVVYETVEETVYETVEEVVYEEVSYEVVDDVVYEVVEEVVYETVEEVVYETVEEVVYEATYFDGVSADVFALVIDEKTASVFGEIVENDVEPIIINDRTMLPARFVAEALGATVEWDGENRVVTVKNDEVEIKLTIDSAIATVNGEEVELDSPACIVNDRTYTPVRFIVENLGATVEWDAELRMVTIIPAAEEAVEEETTEEVVEEEVVEEEVTEETVEEEVVEEETTEEETTEEETVEEETTEETAEEE